MNIFFHNLTQTIYFLPKYRRLRQHYTTSLFLLIDCCVDHKILPYLIPPSRPAIVVVTDDVAHASWHGLESVVQTDTLQAILQVELPDLLQLSPLPATTVVSTYSNLAAVFYRVGQQFKHIQRKGKPHT